MAAPCLSLSRKMTTIRKFQSNDRFSFARFTWFLGVCLLFGCSLSFGDLAEDVWFKEGFTWDVPVALAIHHFRRPWLDGMMNAITQTGNVGAIILVSGIALWFYWRRQPRQAIFLFVTFGGAMALNTLLKLVFARPRPQLFPPLV